MTEISDDAWIALIDYLQQIEPADEIQFAALTDNNLGESELISMLDQATELGMIAQVDARTWVKRKSKIDMSPRKED